MFFILYFRRFWIYRSSVTFKIPYMVGRTVKVPVENANSVESSVLWDFPASIYLASSDFQYSQYMTTFDLFKSPESTHIPVSYVLVFESALSKTVYSAWFSAVRTAFSLTERCPDNFFLLVVFKYFFVDLMAYIFKTSYNISPTNYLLLNYT